MSMKGTHVFCKYDFKIFRGRLLHIYVVWLSEYAIINSLLKNGLHLYNIIHIYMCVCVHVCVRVSTDRTENNTVDFDVVFFLFWFSWSTCSSFFGKYKRRVRRYRYARKCYREIRRISVYSIRDDSSAPTKYVPRAVLFDTVRSPQSVYGTYNVRYEARRVSRRPHRNSIIHTSHLNSGSINKRRHLTRPGVGIVTARAREHAIRIEIFYIIISYSINTGKLKSLRESARKPVPRDFRRPTYS